MSVFPIVMYDSDIGVGLGIKSVVKNRFQNDESFDLTIFGSSKGEQWYLFAVSKPDYELRQATSYPLAVDFKVEYDKLLKSNFFGIGNDSPDNEYQFPREFWKLQLVMSRALTARLIAEMGFLITHYSAYGYKVEWGTLSSQTPGAGETNMTFLLSRVRFDTRDSQIDPSRGIKIEFSADLALNALTDGRSMQRWRGEFAIYRKVAAKSHIVAFRVAGQQVYDDPPYLELSKIGDGWTARGFKAGRFLDRAMALVSAEYRFRIYKKLGGVLFTDAGRVWPRLQSFSLQSWHSDWGGGLRYYLANFVVRLDIGKSVEGTRVFFNFGQVF